jgi:hypothetical protein
MAAGTIRGAIDDIIAAARVGEPGDPRDGGLGNQLILLTQMLTTDLDNPGCGWTKSPPRPL